MKRKLLAVAILVILVMIGILQFLARPVQVNGRPIKPFVYRQIVFAERVTYFFNNPEIGDRIIFLPQDRDIEFVGIITNIEDNNNIRTYTVASGEKAASWIITRDKILYKIYYPFIANKETLQMVSSHITPAPTMEASYKTSQATADQPQEKGVTKPSTKTLSYSLPDGWKTVRDKSGMLEVGYDPNESLPNDKQYDLWIDMLKTRCCGPGQGYNFGFMLASYSGGSRHQFLYNRLGINSLQKTDKLTGFHEKEYSYNGWPCLVFYGVAISQYGTTQGMCAVSSSQALYFSIDPMDENTVEQLIQTVRVLKN